MSLHKLLLVGFFLLLPTLLLALASTLAWLVHMHGYLLLFALFGNDVPAWSLALPLKSPSSDGSSSRRLSTNPARQRNTAPRWLAPRLARLSRNDKPNAAHDDNANANHKEGATNVTIDRPNYFCAR